MRPRLRIGGRLPVLPEWTCRAAVTALIFASAASLAPAQVAPASPIRKATLYEDLQMFSQVLNQIRVNHPDSVDQHALIMAAIEGMIRAADPHSYVLPVARLSAEKARAFENGQLFPVPLTFRFLNGVATVDGIASGTRASRLGIMRGDELAAIGGQPVRANSSEELEIVLAGEKNSSVVLAFERRRSDGSRLRLERTVRRERVGDENSVPVATMLDPATGYVRVITFANPKVADQVHQAIERLKGRGMKQLVLDLRGNGGGIVDQAAEVAGEFLPRGATVHISERRKEPKPDTVTVKRSFWKREDRYPVVVLINEGTASAAELVAGALQDHDRALLVGRPTFGKSLLMQGLPLTDGSVIMLVVGRVRTPCGRVIQREYRGMTVRDYYRLAGAEQDTTGRPNCRTVGGRTVYGGGGVYPDLILPEPAELPRWLERVLEAELPFRWAGGYRTEIGGGMSTPDTGLARPALPETALRSFRSFATAASLELPTGEDADTWLTRVLLLELAAATSGDEGYFSMLARLDPTLRDVSRYFERAAAVLRQ